jgi:hypothetical protein
MNDEKQGEQEVTAEEPSQARETGWSKLDEHDPPPKPKKRAGLVDTVSGGDDERPIVGIPTG